MIVKGLVGQFDAGRKNNRQVFFPFLQQLFGQPSLAAAATPFKIEKPSGPIDAHHTLLDSAVAIYLKSPCCFAVTQFFFPHGLITSLLNFGG